YGIFAPLNGVTITGEANQTLLDVAGIQVIANRQTSTCSATDCFMTTDALYINALGKVTLTLASSSAHLAAPIPEPETYALMMMGLAGLAGSKRIRNRMKSIA
ncbi:MAG TPA: PEP-CTERM sorting domain-containing protein, partial [Methylophilaceae bacterium]|nr:PEP-CTERM sorting domain-containing protein [Methylophilaceae bacterium]